MVWLWMIGVSVLLVIAIMFAPFRVTIEYERIKEEDCLEVNLRLLWLIHFRWLVPTMEFKGITKGIGLAVHSQKGLNVEVTHNHGPQQTKHEAFRIDLKILRSWWRKSRHILRLLKPYDRIIRKAMRTVRIEKFEWKSTVGTGDAAMTGVASGGLLAVKGSLVGWMSNQVSVASRPVITVSPDFRASVFQTHVSCIARCAVGHAIIAVVKLVFFWMREGKSWRSIRFKA